MNIPKTYTLERLLKNTVMVGDCLFWRGARGGSLGYGVKSFRTNGVKVQYFAHRISWFLFTGSEPSDCVLHRCDNPPCINPKHLFSGSHADNAVDKTTKGRSTRQPGESNPMAKLTESAVKEIRLSLIKNKMQLARTYLVTAKSIRNVLNDKTWAGVA